MFNMRNYVSESSKKEGYTEILLFKANYTYGFYYSKELINLNQFADEIEKIEVIDFLNEKAFKDDQKYCDFTNGYIKIYYKDGSIKILDYVFNDDWDYYFFEIVL